MDIKIIGLTKKYEEKRIFENFHFSIQSNEFVIITGKSGCGKTTLLKCLMGIEVFENGQIYYDDYALNENKDFLLSNVLGYVAQEDNLLQELKVEQQIRLNSDISQTSWDEQWYQYLINTLKITDLLKKYISDCSIGECQRIALACALIKKPKVLLLDEPTGSLDEQNTAAFMEILVETRKKYPCTIVMVTHEINLLSYATRFIDLTKSYRNKAEAPINPIHQKPKKKKNLWILPLLKSYYQFHLWKNLSYIFCIALLFISFYLAIDAGTEFKDYIIRHAQNAENSCIVTIRNPDKNLWVDGGDYNKIEAIEHVKKLDYQTLGFRYAYERWEKQPISLSVDGRSISDNDRPLYFHGRLEDIKPISGVNLPYQTDLILSKSIVEALGFSNENIIGKEIIYHIPYVIGYEIQQRYDEDRYSSNLSYLPITETITFKGKVIGVSDSEYNDIFHDSDYISNIILEEIQVQDNKKGLISPLSFEWIYVEVDSFENVAGVISQVQNLGYNCENSVLYLSQTISNLDKMAGIYQFVLIFVLIAMGLVFKIIFDYTNHAKIKFFHHLKQIGIGTTHIKQYLIYDSLYLISMTVTFSCLLLWIAMPIIDRLFIYMNEMILYMQIEANKGIPLFTLSLPHIVVSAAFVLTIMLISMYQLYRQCRRNDLC